jgi:hypothetical protein
MNHPNNRHQRIDQKRIHPYKTNQTAKKLVSTVKRERPLRAKIVRPISSAFISGGIGDVIAVESFLNNEDRQTLNTIFYATNKRQYLEELFKCLTNYPNLRHHETVWDDFSKFWCFYSLEDYIRKAKDQNFPCNSRVKLSKDLSILHVVEDVKKGILKYNNSSFLTEMMAVIDHFDLPPNYFVILPYSTDKRIKKRDFDENDWIEVLETLKEAGTIGIVINSESESIPTSDLLIDLSQKTRLTEAIEILKSAKGYFGIDSWMSVLAAKLFDSPFIQIKSQNQHCYNNAAFYYAPKTNFDFIVSNIKKPTQKLTLP